MGLAPVFRPPTGKPPRWEAALTTRSSGHEVIGNYLCRAAGCRRPGSSTVGRGRRHPLFRFPRLPGSHRSRGPHPAMSMAFLPDGALLVTEQPGRLRVIRDGVLIAEPVAGVPEVFYKGQGGLLDGVPHPDFASNSML